MRKAFFDEIERQAATNENIYILTANLGYSFFDGIRRSCAARFLDVGVAESNMIGIASGLALSGKNVYCYSIIPFLLMRAYEQIRIDIADTGLNVKLVGMGAGFTYGQEGFTHFGLEDLAVMRVLPHMHIVVPDTIENAVSVARLSVDYPFPLYIRLGRAGIKGSQRRTRKFEIGKGIVLSEGADVALLAIGNMVGLAEQARCLLAEEALSTTVVNMHTLKPLDVPLVRELALAHRAVFTLEEHSLNGGLGSAVSEVLAESSYGGIFRRIGIPNQLENVIGDADFLWNHYGFTPGEICRKIAGAVREEKEKR